VPQQDSSALSRLLGQIQHWRPEKSAFGVWPPDLDRKLQSALLPDRLTVDSRGVKAYSKDEKSETKRESSRRAVVGESGKTRDWSCRCCCLRVPMPLRTTMPTRPSIMAHGFNSETVLCSLQSLRQQLLDGRQSQRSEPLQIERYAEEMDNIQAIGQREQAAMTAEAIARRLRQIDGAMERVRAGESVSNAKNRSDRRGCWLTRRRNCA
jgi:hypothetical protein